jgi:hypothetical protein
MKSEVFNIDCMEGMEQYPDKYFDLAKNSCHRAGLRFYRIRD